MNIENALPRFTQIVSREEYHKNYKRTLTVAEDGYIFATGDNIKGKITSVRKRETEAQKDQRVEITKPLPAVSVEMIKKYFRKLRKTDGVKKENTWPNENKRAEQLLNENLADFYARQSAEEYLFDTLEDYTFLDPNSFLVVERYNIIDEQGRITAVKSYPVTFQAENVRNFLYERGLLQYLLIEYIREEKTKTRTAKLSEFRMYGSGWTLHAVEYEEQRPPLEGYEETTISIEKTSRSRNFLFRIYETGTVEVPAIRLGAYLDGQTKTETAITPMEPVKPLVESLINIGSLHDLTVFLHSITRRRELVEMCDYEDEETGLSCEGGYLSKGNACPSCLGTGDKSIKSEQDMIRITLPPNFAPEDIPDLSKLAHVETADVELLRWQQEKIDWLLKFIVYATMTRDAVTMAEVSRTATEMVLNNQEAYDKIQPYAQLYSQAYMLITRITTQYQETYEGFTTSHHFPDDYQFETEKELLGRLKEARDTNAPYEYIARLNHQLIRRQTRSMEEAKRAKAWERWKPWPDATEEMLALVLADRQPQDRDRMLRENFHRIRTEIEEETSGLFYRMPYNAQEGIILTKIQQLTESILFRNSEVIDFEV